MNKVILTGRITKDPELKRTNTDIPVCQFTLAVNRPYTSQDGEKQADFINCVFWRTQAENFAKYLHKGSFIAIEGQIQTRSYEDQSGAKKFITEVIVERFEFLETKSQNNGSYGDVNSYNIPPEKKQEQKKPESNPFDDFQDPFKNVRPTTEKNPFNIKDEDLPF